MDNRISHLVYYQESICVYFKKKRFKIYPLDQTKLKESDVVNGYLKVKNKSDIDTKNRNELINQIHKDYDNAIIELITKYPNIPLTKKLIEANIKRNNEKKTLHSDLLQLYDDFLTFKKNDQDLSPASIKDYVSLKNLLNDYQTKNNETLTIESISMDFINDFHKFMIEDRSKDKRYISKGGLNNNTINKRFSTLHTFLYYLHNKYNYKIDSEIINKNTDKYRPTIVIVEDSEMKQLLKIKFNTDNERFIIDILIFLCNTGLRYSDLITLTRFDVKEENHSFYIEKFAEKTEDKFLVPLNNVALKILNDYDYFENSKLPTNQHFNRVLKEILNKHELMQNYIKIDEFRGTNKIRKKVKKVTEISSHT